MRVNRIVGVGLMAAALTIAVPALGDSGGGGGGGGGMNVPSNSAPAYDPAAEYRKGIQALQANNFKDALKAFKNVLAVAPKDANTNYLAGLSAIGLNDWKKAKPYLEKAAKADPKLIGARRQLGVVKAKMGDTAGAGVERDLLKAKLAECGDTCATNTELKAAIDAIDAAIAAGPQASVSVTLPSAFTNAATGDRAYLAAVSLINEHRYADAIASLQAARMSFGAHPDVLTYLGFANRKLGRYDVAEGYYKAALAIYPNHRGALEYYGELKVERGDLAGARANLAKLDRVCTFGCFQADELRLWIGLGRSPAA
ncbi:MAG: tetratricopeptide repeat protein [Sphingomonas sp.]